MGGQCGIRKAGCCGSILPGFVGNRACANQAARGCEATCTVSAVELAGWFETGAVTPNGIVMPADSVAFPDIPNCSFYKWSQQMFLWLTSPVAPKFGQGNVVFNSQIFFDVTPPVNGERKFVPNEPGQPRVLNVKISQRGPQNQPVVFDAKGNMFSVSRPETGPDGRALIRDKQGNKIAIGSSEVTAGGRALFRDGGGKPIDYLATKTGAPRLLDQAGKPINVPLKTAVINNKTVLLDARGNVIDTETGQADQTVLMTQDKKLVFYALQANDVFAYFLTGAKNGKITPAPTRFPITVEELNKIKAFALANGKTLPDANALAVELKSSWIEADGLDASKYITMTATIPTYETTDPKKFVQNGSKTVLLAMIGLHVVGSAARHPEMIWSTFEHIDNTRNAAYTYQNAANAVISVPSEAGGQWLLSTTPATATPNGQVMRFDNKDGSIVSAGNAPIGPSDTLRVHPWGTPPDSPAFTGNNTDLIAINNSVLGQLGAGDIRKNYIMVGSTWTILGAPPNATNQVGTNGSANSTMETTQATSNCFKCHRGNMLGTPTGGGLSHIWGQLRPLFQ